jgi:hypothetical protein
MIIPGELQAVRAAATAEIAPIKPLDLGVIRNTSFLFDARRTAAGRELPEYYLVYFLLVDLLEFPNLGRWEKTAWSVPIDLYGQPFVVEQRKFGVGVFGPNPEEHEQDAWQIVRLIEKGVTAAKPFFSWLAEQAVAGSTLNVVNRNHELFERFTFLLTEYQKKSEEATERKDEHVIEKCEGGGTLHTYPAFKLRQEAQWLALSAIEAFFSWTEHVLIHIAILDGRIKTGKEVVDLADSDWVTKFKTALDISEPATKTLFDKLVIIRRQIRNFVAHGSFGKQGEAFSFHSGAGAVPVLLPLQAGKQRFRLTGDTTVDEVTTLGVIEDFVRHLWSGHRQSAQLYIKSGLPCILTMASDGTYAEAMSSPEEMEEFVGALSSSADDAANMDW